ncbi:MAG: argininosuccinate lyase, partial [Paracoccaceae bacterium]
NTDAGCITVTELADTLVRDEAITFRLAHQIAAVTAQAVIRDARPLDRGYAAFRSAFTDIVGRTTTLDEAAFSRAVSAQNFIAVRDRFGGPASGQLTIALQGYRDELQEFMALAADNKQQQDLAQTALSDAFSNLTRNQTDQ